MRRGQGLASRAQSEPCTSSVGARESRGYGIQRERPCVLPQHGGAVSYPGLTRSGRCTSPSGPVASESVCALHHLPSEIYRAQNTGYVLLCVLVRHESYSPDTLSLFLLEIAPGCVMEENNEKTTGGFLKKCLSIVCLPTFVLQKMLLSCFAAK